MLRKRIDTSAIFMRYARSLNRAAVAAEHESRDSRDQAYLETAYRLGMLELAPAPPTVALVGLLGMLGGEHMTPLVRTWLAPGIH
jgi:hypothetical protein